MGNDNAFMGGFQLGMPIYNPAVFAGIDVARAEQKIANENFRNQSIDLVFNVQRSWFDVLLAKESLEVINLSFQNASENLENIRKLHNQGLVAEFDLIRAQVQTENLRPDLLQAQNMLDLSVNLLKTLLGIDYQVTVEIEGNLMESSELILNDFNVFAAQQSLTNNPGYINLGLQRELILQQARTLRASSLPSVAAFSNYMYITEANNLRIRDYDWVNTASAGLQLSIPIFRGFTNRNQVKQLEIGAQQLHLQREYLRDNLSIELANILKNMEVALEKTDHAQKNVELAQRGYDISRVRYQSGQGTLLEINDSDIALRRARFNLLLAKHELLQSKVNYDRITGDLAKIPNP